MITIFYNSSFTPRSGKAIGNKTPVHSKITMAGDVVAYYTVTALVPALK